MWTAVICANFLIVFSPYVCSNNFYLLLYRSIIIDDVTEEKGRRGPMTSKFQSPTLFDNLSINTIKEQHSYIKFPIELVLRSEASPKYGLSQGMRLLYSEFQQLCKMPLNLFLDALNRTSSFLSENRRNFVIVRPKPTRNLKTFTSKDNVHPL